MSDVRLIVRRFLKQLGAYLWSNTVLPIIGVLFLIILLLGIAYLECSVFGGHTSFRWSGRICKALGAH